jgi:Rap1a immunity proteins
MRDQRFPLRAAAAVALTIGAIATPVHAQGLSTERLDELCRDPASEAWREIGQWLCPAYIRGLIDGARLQALHVAGSVEGHRQLMQFCVPEHSTAQEAIDAVLRFIKAHPESQGQPAAGTVSIALAAAWPCR